VRNGSKRVAVDLVVDPTAVLRAVTIRDPRGRAAHPRHRGPTTAMPRRSLA